MLLRRLISVAVLLLAATAARAVEPAPLTGAVYGSGADALVIVLHGDVSRGGASDYHYPFAEKVAAQNPGATVVALLRPGYYDDEGQNESVLPMIRAIWAELWPDPD